MGRQYGYLKVETAEVVVATLKPIRERMRALLADRAELDGLLAVGAEKASAVAAKTLADVYDAVGFLPPKHR